jgi:phospholipid/cholesterol/gamma-HCH transport system substrate-binding protein
VAAHAGKRAVEPIQARRPLAGLTAVVLAVATVTFAVALFNGAFTRTAPLTVISPRAGLVLNPNAKVQMRGVQIGTVSSIENQGDGTAAIHLAVDPSQLSLIPSNALVDVASTTVFGAKYVQFDLPPDPSPVPMRAGQTVHAENVTVEINTVFERLNSVLRTFQPEKFKQVMSSVAAAMSGRGQQLGQTIDDLDQFLATVDPSLDNLSHDLAVLPTVMTTYADVSPDLTASLSNLSMTSRTIVSQQHDLDALLVSVIGFGEIGSDVVGTNRQSLTDLLRVLVPTTDLTNEYHQALWCGLTGLIPAAYRPPPHKPGVELIAGLQFGQDRWRYPQNLPKVAAKGGPQCTDLPVVPYDKQSPFVIADVGANPWQQQHDGLVLNADGIKRMLFGEQDGPPRNTPQIGQPG